MSILIKGVEMPTSCEECPLGDSLHCQVLPSVPALWAEYTNAIREKRLHSDCPLIPVPPHGRLIDADALREKKKKNGENEYIYDTNAILCNLDAAPAIIPAEPPKDEAPTGPYDLLYEEGGANTT